VCIVVVVDSRENKVNEITTISMENITFEENGALVPRDENPKCIVSPYGKNVLFSHGVAFRNDYTESVFSGKKIPPPGGASFILLAFGLLRYTSYGGGNGRNVTLGFVPSNYGRTYTSKFVGSFRAAHVYPSVYRTNRTNSIRTRASGLLEIDTGNGTDDTRRPIYERPDRDTRTKLAFK